MLFRSPLPSSSSWFASTPLSAASSKSSASRYGTTGGRGERRRPRVGLGFFDDKAGAADVLEDELDLLGLTTNDGWSISVSREAAKPKLRLKKVRCSHGDGSGTGQAYGSLPGGSCSYALCFYAYIKCHALETLGGDL